MAQNIAQNMAENMAEKTNSLDRSLTLPAVKHKGGSLVKSVKTVIPTPIFLFGDATESTV